MKITFLGTSHGVPAADRYCSSAMIEVNDSVYLIDAGAPAADLLIRRGVNLDTVKAVFTTHLHGDHVFGVIQMASLFNWFFKTADADFYLTEQAGIDAIGKTI
jgi:ribonuclease Z